MQQRVADAAAEKELRIKYQEDAEKAAAQVEKLKEKQKNLVAASAGHNVSAREVQVTEERDKALVCVSFSRDSRIACKHVSA